MGKQFQVNTYTNNWQDEPDILALPNGGFLVTWDSYLNEYDDGPSAYILSGQRYDASGRRVGSEFLIDGIDQAASTEPSITALGDGGYAMAWSYSPDGILGRTQAYVRAFDADGTPRTKALRVDTIDLFEAVQPRVVGTQGGGFMVFYTADKAGPTFDDVYMRRYDADGDPLGRERRMNTREDYLDQGIVETARMANGRIVALWNSESTLDTKGDLDSNELRATVFSPKGEVLRSDVHLSSNFGSAGGGNGQGFSVAEAGNGFVISQMEYGSRFGTDYLYHVVVQTFDDDARTTSGRISAFRTEEVVYSTDVARLSTGEIVVVWEQQPIPKGEVGNDVMARVLSASGRPLTAAFEVGLDYSRYDEQSDPVVEALAGGGFVVSYAHDNLDGDHEGIGARIFGRGTKGNDTVTVDAGNYLSGLGGHDRLNGNSKGNVIHGGAGNDTLLGNGGDDVLYGGPGRDRLTGGRGADDFVFNGKPNGTNGPDRITDFGGNDQILLDNADFRGVGPEGGLSRGAFRVLGEGRVDGSDRILYDRHDGTLYFDADGSGRGARHEFAILNGAPQLDAGDILII
ncbi:calcium-binding protein [Rubellimicrobium arenae]|uniref:calcium-binding protein n=1 Tax=Rubellimicrobium arenae TaxID=2817372 RepID=UPI001B309AF2|nr:calcium-binding protein [Rubellimicrobium arenae]